MKLLKNFDDFINESNNIDREYGYEIFDEVTEAVMSAIQTSINEGTLVLDDAETLNEGLFGSIANIFKKGTDATAEKESELKSEMDALKKYNFAKGMKLSGKEIEKIGAKISRKEIEADVLEKIDKLLTDCETICTNISEKEEESYKTISKKLKETNEAIKSFTTKTVEALKEIAEKSRNKVSDIISATMLLIAKMGEIAKNALKTVGNGIVLGICIPIVIAQCIYKASRSLCKTLCEKSKEVWTSVKDVYASIKTALTEWFTNTFNTIKDELKKVSDKIKEGSSSVARSIGKAYLTVLSVCGTVISDTKNDIQSDLKDVYDSFAEAGQYFHDDVKQIISDSWETVSDWCDKTQTKFSNGIKSVYNKMNDIVKKSVDSINDAKATLEKEANTTWDEFEGWNTERQKRSIKAKLNWATEKWGKDVIQNWLDEMK